MNVVWEGAREALSADPRLEALVERVGPVRMEPPMGPFPSLVRSIVYQQLAGAAAATIHGRVVEALAGRVTPAAVLSAEEEVLRGAGLSRSKVRAIRSLAREASAGSLRLEELSGLPDAEVERVLTRVWGVGPWTAHMFLMFHLRRPDVWPVGDLGVRVGWARIHGLEAPATPEELSAVGAGFRPWRSALAWYCWRAVEVMDPEGTFLPPAP